MSDIIRFKCVSSGETIEVVTDSPTHAQAQLNLTRPCAGGWVQDDNVRASAHVLVTGFGKFGDVTLADVLTMAKTNKEETKEEDTKEEDTKEKDTKKEDTKGKGVKKATTKKKATSKTGHSKKTSKSKKKTPE